MEGKKNNSIGWDLQQGLTSGVPDPDAAIPYYRKAAAAGNTQAMINLGNTFEDREDFEQAYYWYHEAALLGNPDGMFNVANMYHWGRYVRQDYKKAREYFEKLYRMNCRGAAFYLGLYSEYGYAGEKNEAEAVRYYREGLDSGDGYCAVNLGRMYCLGLGVEKDERKGLAYYRRGYQEGDSLACANLGWCYEVGQGTRKNLPKALEYYREGAELGEEHCMEALERLGME